MSTTEAAPNVLEEKLARLKQENEVHKERAEVARVLAEGVETSQREIAALVSLLKLYEKSLLAMSHAKLDALHAAGGRNHCELADSILRDIHAAKVHHEKLLGMSQEADRGRKVGELDDIKVLLEAGRGMAARLEARIHKLAE